MTALGQITGELRDAREWTATIGTTAPTLSNTKARTGSYSVRMSGTTQAMAGFTFAAQSGVRCGVWLNHTSVNGSVAAAPVMTLRGSGAIVAQFVWNGTNGKVQLLISGSVVDEEAATTVGITPTDRWMHVGLVYVASGTCTVYLDGTAILTYAAPATQIDGAYFGGIRWENYIYFDDFYVDGGVTVDEAPPADRFLFSLTSGAGSSAEWTATGAATNYECVDDATPDDDTTYVAAAEADLLDLYATADVTLPTDYVVAAVLPIALAKAAAEGPTIKLAANVGANTTIGDAQTPGASYAYVWQSLATAPDGGGWTQSKINGAQFGYESAGEYS